MLPSAPSSDLWLFDVFGQVSKPSDIFFMHRPHPTQVITIYPGLYHLPYSLTAPSNGPHSVFLVRVNSCSAAPFKIYFYISCEDIGLPAFQALPVGTRVVTGLFQGVAVRASGFQIVAFAALAPALQCVFRFLFMLD